MANNRPVFVASSEHDAAADERRAAAVALVAQDHRRLDERAGSLFVAIEAAAGQAIVRECIEGLIATAREHFVNEEWAMRTVKAPDYQAHKAAHGRLLRDASDMLKNFDTAFVADDWPAVAKYFSHWIRAHHRRYDAPLSAHLRGKDDADPPAA